MTPDDRVKKLELAARLVDLVVRSMDCRTIPCKCCGFKKFANWQDSTLNPQLESVSRKLRNFATAFRDNPTGVYTPKPVLKGVNE